MVAGLVALVLEWSDVSAMAGPPERSVKEQIFAAGESQRTPGAEISKSVACGLDKATTHDDDSVERKLGILILRELQRNIPYLEFAYQRLDESLTPLNSHRH